MEFRLKIIPKVDIETRHHIQGTLEKDGYHVTGGGQTVGVPDKESFSDISFDNIADEEG